MVTSKVFDCNTEVLKEDLEKLLKDHAFAVGCGTTDRTLYIDLSARTFIKASFDARVLDMAAFKRCFFHRCSFRGAKAYLTQFENCWFNECVFTESSFFSAMFAESTFTGCHLDKVGLASSSFSKCEVDACTFHRSNLDHATFTDCLLIGPWFCFAEMTGVKFENSEIRESSWWYGALIRDLKFLRTSVSGVSPNFLMVGPIGSRGDMLIVVSHPMGVRYYKTGCFYNTEKEFKHQVDWTHGDNVNAYNYEKVIAMARDVLADGGSPMTEEVPEWVFYDDRCPSCGEYRKERLRFGPSLGGCGQEEELADCDTCHLVNY